MVRVTRVKVSVRIPSDFSPLNSRRQKAIASEVASEHRHFGGQKIASDNFSLNPCLKYYKNLMKTKFFHSTLKFAIFTLLTSGRRAIIVGVRVKRVRVRIRVRNRVRVTRVRLGVGL